MAANITRIVKDGSTVTKVLISFTEGGKSYEYNEDQLSQFELQEMIRIYNAGHGGLRRYMHKQNILVRNKKG